MTRILCIILGTSLLLPACKNQKVEALQNQVTQLNDQIEHMQTTNTSLLDRLSDLSVINQTEAKTIQSSLENINRQNEFIHTLTEKIHEKDSINLALVTNLKRSLMDINDRDVQVEVRGGAVYVSISDQLLFTTGSARISPSALSVLGKVATVINDHDQLNVLIEGHTDDVPISNDLFSDNWDLSVSRATAVVRALQNEYYVNPARLTAAGRSSYVPKSDNNSASSRSKNRRTEIILTPKLDQFFELLESPDLPG